MEVREQYSTSQVSKPRSGSLLIAPGERSEPGVVQYKHYQPRRGCPMHGKRAHSLSTAAPLFSITRPLDNHSVVDESNACLPGVRVAHPGLFMGGPRCGPALDGCKNFHPVHLRAYGLRTGDYQMVDAWWRARRRSGFPENMVPPLGVIAERDGKPLAALWAYQSAGIGVAFLEFAVTAPGLSFKDARAALGRALLGIEAILRRDGYSVARCFCAPAMARALRAFGFRGENGNLMKSF
jgi:hypothetical protein